MGVVIVCVPRVMDSVLSCGALHNMSWDNGVGGEDTASTLMPSRVSSEECVLP